MVGSDLREYLPNQPIKSNTRVERILEHVPKDATVLDIGCVQHDLSRTDDNTWLHGRLVDRAENVVGLDYLEDEIIKMQEQGYDVVSGNAESFQFNQTFDVIIAGELIEHLSNPGKFLNCASKHIKDDGKLILTTPNVWFLSYLVKALFGGPTPNPEHTCWFDVPTLSELLSRYSFEINTLEYVRPSSWKFPYIHKQIEWATVSILHSAGFQYLGGNRLLVVASQSES